MHTYQEGIDAVKDALGIGLSSLKTSSKVVGVGEGKHSTDHSDNKNALGNHFQEKGRFFEYR